jgi:hypothetical protein
MNVRLRHAAALGAIAATLGLGTGVADAQTRSYPTYDETPPELAVPDGNRLSNRLYARGVQIYDCVDSAWKFREPAATLTRRSGGRAVTIHYKGPTFQSLRDGSSVTGEAIANVPAADPTTTIPELLVKAVSNAGGASSIYGGVTFVQRLDTQGGAAPAGACDAATQPSLAVPYSATYTFWVAE